MTALNLVETAALIDGQWVRGEASFDVLNPADGTLTQTEGVGPERQSSADNLNANNDHR